MQVDRPPQISSTSSAPVSSALSQRPAAGESFAARLERPSEDGETLTNGKVRLAPEGAVDGATAKTGEDAMEGNEQNEEIRAVHSDRDRPVPEHKSFGDILIPVTEKASETSEGLADLENDDGAKQPPISKAEKAAEDFLAAIEVKAGDRPVSKGEENAEPRAPKTVTSPLDKMALDQGTRTAKSKDSEQSPLAQSSSAKPKDSEQLLLAQSPSAKPEAITSKGMHQGGADGGFPATTTFVAASKDGARNSNDRETALEARGTASALVEHRFPRDQSALDASPALPPRDPEVSKSVMVERGMPKPIPAETFARSQPEQDLSAPLKETAEPYADMELFDQSKLTTATRTMPFDMATVRDMAIAVGAKSIEAQVQQTGKRDPEGDTSRRSGESADLFAAQAPGPAASAQRVVTIPQAPPPTQVPQQIAEAIAAAKGNGVELRLSPVELGRVSISISQGDLGLTVSLVADRPETIDLMRRHAQDLQTALGDLDMGSVDLSFSHRERGGGQAGPGPLDFGPAGESSEPGEMAVMKLEATGRLDRRM